MKAIRIISLLVALGMTQAAVADSWDTMGGRHSHDGVRYGYDKGHAGRGHARGYNSYRSEVNIIVAPQAPLGNWAPSWNDRHFTRYNSRYNNHFYDRRNDFRRDQFVFNSSLGFIAGSVVGLATAPQVIEHNYYVREYAEPVTVIQHDSRSTSVNLYRDRYGACYERKKDHYGRVVKRRIADYNCNF